jgi:putative nucleotidyltransferase with HDIG domain
MASNATKAPYVPSLQAFLPTARVRRSRALLLVAVGIVAVGAGGVVAFVGSLLFGEPYAEAVVHGVWGLIGATISGFVAVASIPALRFELLRREHARLLEAANPMHPLLRQLMTVAPGTYAHSLSVGGLSEAAAASIGADALLTRVAAYYHDVGKMRRPQFFFENQAGGVNPHDEAKPSLSALIITAHVTDGLELAEQYHLPKRVLQIIREHHGTSLIRYFYHKASAGDVAVVENDFRYHGGRPTSREAAIVMLADTCEAAVRALNDPTVERIRGVVESVVADKTADHQLEEANFAEGQLEAVVESLIHGLISSYHARCAYPSLTKKTSEEQC